MKKTDLFNRISEAYNEAPPVEFSELDRERIMAAIRRDAVGLESPAVTPPRLLRFPLWEYALGAVAALLILGFGALEFRNWSDSLLLESFLGNPSSLYSDTTLL